MKKKIVFLLTAMIIFTYGYSNPGETLEDLKEYKPKSKNELGGGKDYILNYTTPYNLVIYFKLYEREWVQYLNDILEKDRIEVLKFFNEEKLKNYYSRDYLQLENGEKYFFGRIDWEYHEPEIKLELYYIDENNEEKKRVYFKKKPETLLYKTIDKLNSDKREGFYYIPTFKEEVTIFTSKKIIHKKLRHLSEEERTLYESMLNLFKEEIPKEFFKKREKIS